MEITTQENKNFPEYAKKTYLEKKEAVDFLADSLDPFEHAIGFLIKKYSGSGQNA